MRSALYEGTLSHRRAGPGGHRFSYRLAMPYLDLAELDEVFALHPLWSVERANAVSFRRRDFLGEPGVPLDTSVRTLVEDATGRWPGGPIGLLAHVRTWGWLFNPIAVYFCMDAGGQVEALVLDVTNTPWNERHTYVLDGGAGEHTFPKQLHVSPFFGMDHEYRLRITEPGQRLGVQLDLLSGGEATFRANLTLRRRPIRRRTLGRLLWRYPLLTHRVSAGIYHQAARLWRRGTPYHPHPKGSVARPTELEVR